MSEKPKWRCKRLNELFNDQINVINNNKEHDVKKEDKVETADVKYFCIGNEEKNLFGKKYKKYKKFLSFD